MTNWAAGWHRGRARYLKSARKLNPSLPAFQSHVASFSLSGPPQVVAWGIVHVSLHFVDITCVWAVAGGGITSRKWTKVTDYLTRCYGPRCHTIQTYNVFYSVFIVLYGVFCTFNLWRILTLYIMMCLLPLA